MIVAIDMVGSRTGGAITVGRELLSHFCRLKPEWKFRVFLMPEALNAMQLPASSNLEFVTVPDARGRLSRVIWQQRRLPRLASKIRADVIFSLTNIGPRFSRVPTVVYCQQTLLFFRENFKRKRSLKEHLHDYFRKLSVFAGFRGASAIISQTNVMRKAIIDQAGIPPKLVICVPTGSPMIKQQPSPEDELRTNAVLEKVRRMNGPVALYLSHPSQHKNFDLLFRAAKRMKSQLIPGSFALTLDKKWSGNSFYNRLVANYLYETQKLNVEDRVILIGSIPPSGVGKVLKECYALVFPSLSESFPQPLVEAMKAGLPLLLADRPYAREIAGEAGLFFNPIDDGSDLARLMRILAVDTEKVKRLREKSFERSSLFNYKKSAAMIIEILSSVAAK